MTLQLATAALFLLSTLSGNSPVQAESDMSAKMVIPRPVSALEVNQPVTLEKYVRDYFEETPVLAEIAKCESRFRHVGKNGKVIRGELSAEDIGVMQINEFYHEERAARLGLDLHTLDGNLAYAKWLYRKEGTFPWSSSNRCWQKADTLAKANARAVTN